MKQLTKKLVLLLLVFSFVFSVTACGTSDCSHSYTSQITKAATCKDKGIRTYTCSLCGNTYTEDISKTNNHSYSSQIIEHATCSSSGTKKFSCICGDNYTESYNLDSYTASQTYDMVKNSVGEIVVYDQSGSELALGTCFVYAQGGKIITNYHVIENSYSAKIHINNGTYSVDKILAYDENIDLAVLKISATNLSPLSICKKTHSVGKSVFAIGSSRGLTSTFSQGIITTALREIEGVQYVQHDAAISNGNSGGPLVNEYCEVIGINTMSMKDSQNLNFAISVTEIDNLDFSNEIDYGEHNPSVPSEPSSNLFTTMKNLAMSKGTYEDGEYEYDFVKSNNFIYSLNYDTSDNVISLTLFYISSDSKTSDMLFIYIDQIDGVYNWSYISAYTTSSYYNYMNGILYASTWTQDSILSVADYQINTSSSLSTMKASASTSLDILLKGIDTNLSSYGITSYNLGFTQFTSSSSTNNIFNVMKNYAISNGEYDDGEYEAKVGVKYSSDYAYSYTLYLIYDSSDQEIQLQLFVYSTELTYLVTIFIDEVDGTYDWNYVDNLNNYMGGEIKASTWDTGYLLGYSYNNLQSTSLRDSVRKLSSSAVNILLNLTTDYLSSKGITAYKLGFINF